MPSTALDTSERIDLRTSPEIKQLIVRAASTTGMTVSAFLLAAGQHQAREVLAEQESLTLSARDWDTFARTLDKIDKPRPKLSAALQRHRKWEDAQQ